MKKVIGLILIAAFFIPVMMTSCKKGPNDPFLSLSSRKARLVGEWEVSKCTIKTTSGSSVTTTTYDNGTYTYAVGSTSVTGTYDWTFSIKKDGTYSYKRSVTVSGNTTTTEVEGKWFFSGANKEEDIKNKEMVCFQPTKVTTNTGGTTSTYSEEGSELEWYLLDKLSNKQIDATYEYNYTAASSYSVTVNMTLTQ